MCTWLSKYAVFTNKNIQSLRKNQYNSDIESGSTRTEIKYQVKLFFGVWVKAIIVINSHESELIALPDKLLLIILPYSHLKSSNQVFAFHFIVGMHESQLHPLFKQQSI